jgi:hypothetical protein
MHQVEQGRFHLGLVLGDKMGAITELLEPFGEAGELFQIFCGTRRSGNGCGFAR